PGGVEDRDAEILGLGEIRRIRLGADDDGGRMLGDAAGRLAAAGRDRQLRLLAREALSGVFFFQAEDGIRVLIVTGVQTCALQIYWWYQSALGFTYHEVGRYEESRRLSERSLAQYKGNANASHNIAHVCYETVDNEGGKIGRASCREREKMDGIHGAPDTEERVEQV